MPFIDEFLQVYDKLFGPLGLRVDEVTGTTPLLEPGTYEVRATLRCGALKCRECGLADDQHDTWCPHWRPYEAGE